MIELRPLPPLLRINVSIAISVQTYALPRAAAPSGGCCGRRMFWAMFRPEAPQRQNMRTPLLHMECLHY